MQEFPLTKNLLVPPELHGQRIDQVLAQLFPDMSRRAARRHLSDGRVFVNGRRVRTQGRPVVAGAELRVEPAGAAGGDGGTPVTQKIDVLWQRDDLIAISKPSGLPSEPTRQGSAGVASEQLKTWLRERGESPSFLAAVHRLDIETSGILLFATHRDAVAEASEAFRTGRVLRRYIAVVDHHPFFQRRSLQGPLVRVSDRSRRYAVSEEGKASRTDVLVCSVPPKSVDEGAGKDVVQARGHAGAVLYVEPYTGRTHQIRVHLADAGHPITGDHRYGGQRCTGFGLHAVGLSLPWRSSWLHFEAAVPGSFRAAATLVRCPADVIDRATQVWGLDGETKGERCPSLG